MKAKRFFFPAFFIAVLMTFSGCMSTYRTTYDPFRINEFPTPPHNNEIQVFFPGEKLPEKEYIQTHTFEAINTPGAPMSVQLSQIRQQARDAGVDAVIIMSHGNQAETHPYGGMIWVNNMTALGIKFKENVDYLHMYRYVDQLYAFNADKDTFELVANLYPDFKGIVSQVEVLDEGQLGRFYFENYIRRYSLDFLLGSESPNWKYKTNLSGQITRRDYFRDGSRQIRLRMNYEPGTQKLSSIDAEMYGPGDSWHKYQIGLEYGTNRLISKKEIAMGGKPELIERFYYDELGRLLSSTYHRVVDGQEQAFLQTHYYYYENEDVFKSF